MPEKLFDSFSDYWEHFLNKNPGYCPGNIHELRKQCYEAGFEQGRLARQEDIDAKQAEIDQLMLEYCPDEMTQEQINEWAEHQAAVNIEVLSDFD